MLSVKMSNTHEAAVGNEQMQRKTKDEKEKGKISFHFGNWPRKCAGTGNVTE